MLQVARDLLGTVLEADGPQGTVAVRLSEVEAYAGPVDPASHAYRGRTRRNAVMFGPPGHLYVYFVYGMHWCCNVVCGPDGDASAVLLRAGAVVSGLDLARTRRPGARSDAELARGPARLATALGIGPAAGGADLLDPASPVRLTRGDPIPEEAVRRGPRVGVAAAGEVQWRLWVAGDPTVSPYRPRPAAASRPAGHPRPADRRRPHGRLGSVTQTTTARSAVTPDDLPPRLREAHDRLVYGAAEVLPAEGLAERLLAADREGRPLRVKLGIDPSGASLTLGHAVVLRKLRQFQDLGHTAVLIVGGFTGRVGDPSGRTNTRAALTAEQTAENSRHYFEQLMRVLDADRVEVRDNAEWLDPLSMSEIMSYAREVTVARLLERDDFARRHREHLPITLVEFFYPLLQGIDSVAIRSDVELGGTDQTFNNLMGRDLQRAHGQPPQAVLTVPLLVGLDGGEKMGKSLDNWVGIEEPPEAQFGKLMSIPDTAVGQYARLTTDLGPAEADELERAAATGGPPANEAKRRLAREVVALYHGREAADAAEARFDAVFRQGEVPDDVPERRLPPGDPVHLPALLVELGFAPSTTAARRLIDDGAVRVDGERLAARDYDQPRQRLAGHALAAGRRRLVRLAD